VSTLTQAPVTVLAVSEIFGPTFQGEGPSVGRRCAFLRLAGCNLACRWCDTPYSWDWTGANGLQFDPKVEVRQRSNSDVWDELRALGTEMLVLTGGEPLLQQRQVYPVVSAARAAGWRIEVETAGTLAPTGELAELVDAFNVSLKLTNSGNVRGRRESAPAIAALLATGKANWKFVVQSASELDEVANFERNYGLSPIFIMPEGTTADAILARSRELAVPVLERGWNITTRLHVLLYGNRRGV
jgi:7-cyano-7-deazaguanosine (preQ0) biosynthesis protein QueE